jgi:hypothetical protein
LNPIHGSNYYATDGILDNNYRIDMAILNWSQACYSLPLSDLGKAEPEWKILFFGVQDCF